MMRLPWFRFHAPATVAEIACGMKWLREAARPSKVRNFHMAHIRGLEGARHMLVAVHGPVNTSAKPRKTRLYQGHIRMPTKHDLATSGARLDRVQSARFQARRTLSSTKPAPSRSWIAAE